MTIQWFPGHMAKSTRLIKETLSQVDAVLEIRDARIPFSSHNPLLYEVVKHKPMGLILNKADLADPAVSQLWTSALAPIGKTLLLNTHHKTARASITNFGREVIAHAVAQKKLRQRPIYNILILGVPNVGKSAIINTLKGYIIAKVENRPGVTRTPTWFTIAPDLRCLDSPGILWPKFENNHIGLGLAVTGAIKENVTTIEHLVAYLIDYLRQHYPDSLVQRYALAPEVLLQPDPMVIVEAIGKQRRMLLKEGEIDIDRAIQLILKDFRGGLLGRVSLERP
jgi:ribosome biogenesis GTPase A